eukprot:Platyproteum_vivax@DN6302_c0_g1_i1.p1
MSCPKSVSTKTILETPQHANKRAAKSNSARRPPKARPANNVLCPQTVKITITGPQLATITKTGPHLCAKCKAGPQLATRTKTSPATTSNHSVVKSTKTSNALTPEKYRPPMKPTPKSAPGYRTTKLSEMTPQRIIVEAPNSKLIASCRSHPRSPTLFTHIQRQRSVDDLNHRIISTSKEETTCPVESYVVSWPRAVISSQLEELLGDCDLPETPTPFTPINGISPTGNFKEFQKDSKKGNTLVAPSPSQQALYSPALASTIVGSDLSSPVDTLGGDSPTPVDVFSLIQSDPDATKAKEIVDATFEKCIEEMTLDKGWKKLGEKNGVNCERRDIKKQPAVCKGSVLFGSDWDPETIIDFVWNESSCFKYDPSLDKAFRLKTWSDELPLGLCAYYQAYKGQMGFPGRDFVLVGAKKQIDNDHYISCCQTAPMEHLFTDDQLDQAKKQKCVRAHIFIAALDCRRLSNGLVQLTLVNQLDPNERWAPEMILNQLYVEQLQKVGSVRKSLEKEYPEKSKYVKEVTAFRRGNSRRSTL